MSSSNAEDYGESQYDTEDDDDLVEIREETAEAESKKENERTNFVLGSGMNITNIQVKAKIRGTESNDNADSSARPIPSLEKAAADKTPI